MKAALPLHAAALALLFLSACSSGGFSAVELLAAEDDEPQRPPWFARADLSAEVEACDDPEEIEADPETLPDMLDRSEEHTSELQSRENLVCRLLLEKKKKQTICPRTIITQTSIDEH